jgi:hypothetical protein
MSRTPQVPTTTFQKAKLSSMPIGSSPSLPLIFSASIASTPAAKKLNAIWSTIGRTSPKKVALPNLDPFRTTYMVYPDELQVRALTSKYNVKQRWKATMRLDGAVGNKIPSSFVDLPQFYDHSLLLYLNDAAFKCGLPPIFCDLHPIRDNNGEVFLSKYFDAQIGWNNSVKQDPKTKLCLCPTCKARVLAPASPFPQEQVTALQVNRLLLLQVDQTAMTALLCPSSPPRPHSHNLLLLHKNSHNHQQQLSLCLPSHLQKWCMVLGCRGRMIAATW